MRSNAAPGAMRASGRCLFTQRSIHACCRLLWRKFVDKRLLEILVCPLCKGPLTHVRADQELICTVDKLAYPIRDGIPALLVEEAWRRLLLWSFRPVWLHPVCLTKRWRILAASRWSCASPCRRAHRGRRAS